MPRHDSPSLPGTRAVVDAASPRSRKWRAAEANVFPSRKGADRDAARMGGHGWLAQTERTARSDRASALRLLLPGNTAGETLAERRHVVARLEKALRCERRLGRAGHWAYDLSRHVALTQWLRHEREALQHTSQETGRPEGQPVEQNQSG